MIFQRTSGMRENVREFGCYYMCVLWHAAVRDPESHFITVHDINHTIYEKFVREDWMSADCYVKDPESMFAWLGHKVVYKGHVPSDRVLGENEFGIMKWVLPTRGWSHFVACDEFGNTTYDPWGVSETATRGRRESMRLFEYLGAVR